MKTTEKKRKNNDNRVFELYEKALHLIVKLSELQTV